VRIEELNNCVPYIRLKRVNMVNRVVHEQEYMQRQCSMWGDVGHNRKKEVIGEHKQEGIMKNPTSTDKMRAHGKNNKRSRRHPRTRHGIREGGQSESFGPIRTSDRHDKLHLKSFVDDHSRFGAVYLVTRKPDMDSTVRKCCDEHNRPKYTGISRRKEYSDGKFKKKKGGERGNGNQCKHTQHMCRK
jgi:hypothetical protein